MENHELRLRAVGEMHLRRWPLLPVPCHVIQWVLMLDDSERTGELAAIESRSDPQPNDNPSHREGRLSNKVRFAWERHSEGSSLTLFVKECDEAGFLDPATDAEIASAIEWAEALPGKIVRSTRVWLAAKDSDVETLLPQLNLNSDEMVSSMVGGTIRIWSDFRIKEDGFGKLIVAANGADRRELTRKLQQLQELGNYRNRALLGLPMAKECWPRLDDAEERLRLLADRIANAQERDDTLMDAMSKLGLDLASIATAISFRMDATKAYAQLVEERLVQLDPAPVPGFASLADFTQRRFVPAMSTCLATTERIQRLGVRAEQLASLLRARIETRIEHQNGQLLHSMERSIAMQVRLQTLVEGLSVVALSYYLIGLLSYLLGGIKPDLFGLDDKTVLGALIVPVVLAIWMTTRALKNRLLGEVADEAAKGG